MIPRNGAAVMRSQDGFSMSEAVLVAAVMAIVMGMAVPMTTNSMRNMQLLSDSRKIASSLALAKLSSTSKGVHYQVLFNVSGNQWSLQKYNAATGSFETDGSTNSLSTGLADSGIAFKATSGSAPTGFPTESSAFIRFNSRGIPITAAGTTTASNVIFVTGNNIDYAITVSLSGKVQLWKLRSRQWVAE